jgi:putative cardiolipin synthase
MHNKSFTADGAVTIVGGRNVGDEYFDLDPEMNFRDRELLAAGRWSATSARASRPSGTAPGRGP